MTNKPLNLIYPSSVIKLSAEDSLALAEAILNPREPNQYMKAAFARYRAEVRDCTGEIQIIEKPSPTPGID